jgi:hypothetical protein
VLSDPGQADWELREAEGDEKEVWKKSSAKGSSLKEASEVTFGGGMFNSSMGGRTAPPAAAPVELLLSISNPKSCMRSIQCMHINL